MNLVPCPCASGAPEHLCCGPIVAGRAAHTALELMRSRYTAYVRGAIDHIVASNAPETRATVNRDEAVRWSKNTQWRGLEIVAHEGGGASDATGTVEFIARGTSQNIPFAQHERSRFRKDAGDGRWYYVDGDILPNVPVPSAKALATAGRNDACPCGSGKKFKKCHGA